MSLTPVFQDESLCAVCPLRALCDEEVTTLDVLDLYEEIARATSFLSLMKLFAELDRLLIRLDRIKYRAEIDSPDVAWKTHETMRDRAIEDETTAEFEQYDKLHRPVISLLPIVAAPATLDERLAEMVGLRTETFRRPNPKRTRRNGRRYKVIQDHGTAAGRKGIEQMRQRRAKRHDKDLHWRIARERKAMRRR